MKKYTQKQIKEARNFLNELPLVVDKAFRIELYKTAHALTEAQRTAGYELADIITNSKKDK